MRQPHKLEILLTWLEDNENMGTDLFFAEGVDSADMLPAVRAAVELLNMPKAEKYAPPWDAYYSCEALPSDEISKEEARIWNAAQKYVMDKLHGRGCKR